MEEVKVIQQKITDRYAIYQGDCVEVIKGIPDNSIGYSLFSPPFENLYTYSNSERDMGNSKTRSEFWNHYKFLIKELFRVIKPGRSVSFHCMNIPIMKERDGYIGIRDFRGEQIKLFQEEGFIYHSEVLIWKDPLIEATRTKALGLMHKQLVKDSAICRQGLPDYVVTMRKPGDNLEFVGHPEGLTSYAGKDDPGGDNVKRSHYIWQKYASPVWMDIRQTLTLQKESARDEKDEKHICPLQLDVIERCLTLWSNPNDIILSPFAGIGSEGYKSVEMGRRFIGIELKDSYFEQQKKNLENVSSKKEDLQQFIF